MTEVPKRIREAYRELPPDWKLEKLKFFADIRSSNVDKTIAEDEESVLLCNYTDVYYNECITQDLHFMQGSATKAEIERFQLKRGQVIVTKDSEGWDDIGIPALITEDMPEVLCGYHLSVFEPTPELDGGFLAWLCRSEPLNDQFKLAANGVTRFGLGQYPMKNAFIVLPLLDTQRRIARFLDEKTAQIDGLIAKKRELLDRLAEKRQALITRTVTKGLNPDASMKPSGIDWLGDIPTHWDIVPLRWYLRTASGEGLRNVDIADEQTETDYAPVIGGNGTMGFIDATNSEKAILVIGRVGAHCGNVHPIDEPSWITDNALQVYDVRGFDRDYLLFNLRTRDLNALASRNAQPLMTGETVKAQYLPCPPTSEQQAIGKELEQSLGDLEDNTTRVNQSVRLLSEYRSAIISAAVTGQLTELR